MSEITQGSLVEAMVGAVSQPTGKSVPSPQTVASNQPRLEVSHLRVPATLGPVRDVSFTLHAGECVGLVGLQGSGTTTVADAIVGLVKPAAGEIWNPFLGIAIVLLVGLVVGAINGFLVIKLGFNAFILTLAMLILLALVTNLLVLAQIQTFWIDAANGFIILIALAVARVIAHGERPAHRDLINYPCFYDLVGDTRVGTETKAV